MDRRGFIELWAGFGASALLHANDRTQPERIVVIGGGIIGMSIAYHLARRGAQVLLCEKVCPGNGATSKSFAWINADFRKRPKAYHLLSVSGVFGWYRLQRELQGGLTVQLGGTVSWSEPGKQADTLSEDVRQFQMWGYATELVDEAKFHELLPNVKPGPLGVAAFSEYEGTVNPLRALDAISRAAEHSGAKLLFPCEVTGFELSSGRINAVQTSGGRFRADVVVLAAGVDTPRLAGKLGVQVPLVPSPGVLAHTAALPTILPRVALAPSAAIKQNPDGEVVTGVGFGGSPVTDTSREYGQQLVREAARFVPRLSDASVDRVTLGWRPLPKDGFPIVGFTQSCPNLYVAVMHSGITLSPLMGALASLEILDNADVDLLQPYRLSRFGSGD